MAEKLKDQEQAKRLWDMGVCDAGIAEKLGCKVNQVVRWRRKNEFCPNPGRLLEKSEIMLPELGQELMKSPSFLKMDNEEVRVQKAVVVYVNRSHLYYTVEYIEMPGRIRESFKEI